MRKLHPFNQRCNLKIDPVIEVLHSWLIWISTLYEPAYTDRNTTLLKWYENADQRTGSVTLTKSIKSYPFTTVAPCSDQEGIYGDMWPEGSGPQEPSWEEVVRFFWHWYSSAVQYCFGAQGSAGCCNPWGLRELPGLIKGQIYWTLRLGQWFQTIKWLNH